MADPEGKRFPLLRSVLPYQFYFHLCNFIIPFNKRSSALSYHLFDIWHCKSVVHWGSQQHSPECKEKPSIKPLDFYYISLDHIMPFTLPCSTLLRAFLNLFLSYMKTNQLSYIIHTLFLTCCKFQKAKD